MVSHHHVKHIAMGPTLVELCENQASDADRLDGMTQFKQISFFGRRTDNEQFAQIRKFGKVGIEFTNAMRVGRIDAGGVDQNQIMMLRLFDRLYQLGRIDSTLNRQSQDSSVSFQLFVGGDSVIVNGDQCNLFAALPGLDGRQFGNCSGFADTGGAN